MTDFPFYQHYAVKLTLLEGMKVDENLVDKIADLMVDKLKLTVVSRGKYEFTNDGITKFWLLSQSHLVIHTWPEVAALHVDLMTCSTSVTSSKMIKDYLSSLPIKNISVTELKY